MVRLSWRGIAMAVLISLFPVSAALAQEPTDSEIAEARALFMAGQAAVDSGRWADAVDSFSRAYELSGVGAALYNLGFAYRALGRHREARDAFDALLQNHPDFDRQKRREAQRYRDESAGRVGVVTILGLSETGGYVVRFDGRAITDDGSRPFVVEGDPGTHTLIIRSPGFTPFLWEDELGDGQHITVDVEMEAVPVAGGAESTARGVGGSEAVPSEVDEAGFPWWGWALIAGAILVGGGIAAYLVHQDMQLEGSSERVYEL